MNQFAIDAALKKIRDEIEEKYPRPVDLYSRLSEFRNVIYEIVSREVRDDCICVRAEYVGEDPEVVFPDLPDAE